MLHPEIEKEWKAAGRTFVLAEDLSVPNGQLYKIGIRWIARRASQICRTFSNGMPTRSALDQACNESGLEITEEMRRRIWANNQRELDTVKKVPIVIVSEKENQDSIEAAHKRGDIMIGKFK